MALMAALPHSLRGDGAQAPLERIDSDDIIRHSHLPPKDEKSIRPYFIDGVPVRVFLFVQITK